jgi:hypothetical protein
VQRDGLVLQAQVAVLQPLGLALEALDVALEGDAAFLRTPGDLLQEDVVV